MFYQSEKTFDPNEIVLDPNEIIFDENEIDPNEIFIYLNETEFYAHFLLVTNLCMFMLKKAQKFRFQRMKSHFNQYFLDDSIK